MDIAEKLKIYKLPPQFSKNNKISLKKFDSIDFDGKKTFLGTTGLLQPINPNDNINNNNNNTTNNSTSAKKKINVRNEKGEMKLIILQDTNLEELKTACIKKFQIKKKKGMQFHSPQGMAIENNESLSIYLNDNDVIVFKLL